MSGYCELSEQYPVTIFPTAAMNGSDGIRYDTFCDSFFYAQGMIPVQMDEGYKEGNYAILIRRKKHEL